MQLEITVHIRQTIKDSDTFVFVAKCVNVDGLILTELCIRSVFDAEMISSDNRSIDISDTFKLLYFVNKNVEISI